MGEPAKFLRLKTKPFPKNKNQIHIFQGIIALYFVL